MREFLSTVLISGLGFFLLVCPALAHHSFAAEYDSTKPIDITGAVTKVEWMNPHIYFYVNVRGATGKTSNFAIEGGSPNALRRQRWGKNSIHVGEVITVSGFRAKNGSNTVNAVSISLPDGSTLFAGSSYDIDGPRKAK